MLVYHVVVFFFFFSVCFTPCKTPNYLILYVLFDACVEIGFVD